jgi:hypothetical protein
MDPPIIEKLRIQDRRSRIEDGTKGPALVYLPDVAAGEWTR